MDSRSGASRESGSAGAESGANGDGSGGSELPDLKAEFNDLPHLRGTMSMARAQSPDSANSQFFIMLMPNLSLDGNYTAVGRVISGMQYVDAIEKGEPPVVGMLAVIRAVGLYERRRLRGY